MKHAAVTTARRPPAPRVLCRSLLLALASLHTGAALAGNLDGQTADVGAADPTEAWTLKNGSLLTVNGGASLYIEADNSTVILSNATVDAGSRQSAVTLSGGSTLAARSTRFAAGILVTDSSTAWIEDSEIIVTAAGLSPGAASVGIGLSGTASTLPGDSLTVVRNTYLRVEDVPGTRDINSGLGVRLMGGEIQLQNSRIDADNMAALLATANAGQPPITLRIDNSALRSRRGAAIRVAPRELDAEYRVIVTNGSQLQAGDGNLLLMQSWSGSPVASAIHTDFTVDNARLIGNVNLDTTTVANGVLDVLLRNKAQIDGRFINVTSASIDSDSTWLMTGDSNVGHLALGSTGTVALGNGSTFNTLSVDTFDGAGGTLLFNTQLGDDASATDKLIIKGDANGQANVRVLNAGGAGAKTDKGIELIRVGGASNAQFDLQGRAVGGQYEYFLFKDATNGGWYLRSELAGAPDPCVIDPSLPECHPVDPVDPVDPIDPTPVLRPEAGAYLANQFAMDQLLRHGWRDRQGGSTSAVDGVRGWARVDATQSKLSAVQDQLDLRVDRSRLQLGADIGVFDNGQGRVGVMGTLAKSDATSRSQLTGYSARGKVNGGALGVYGNWSTDALYVDASVQRGQFRNRVQGEGLAGERYDSDIWQSSLEAGYRFGIGQIGSTALSLQPELQLVYTDANTDRHEEANGTVVRSLGDSGLSGRMGLRLRGEGRSAAGASVSPYVVANWYRDGASNGMAFDDEALTASVPRNRYELNAGARVDFRSGLSAWGGFGVMRGDHGYREATANVSVAYRW
ncbi:autotransporter outer membrane beta-barrel domain-containing protein [Stenotrophomonas sp. NRRL B-14846]|uniref:autotransporter family protein n=1 Tax=Stenotrophomonas sp. NRRL B-14846 TaxID=3162882 RepID=UPI003D2B8B06